MPESGQWNSAKEPSVGVAMSQALRAMIKSSITSTTTSPRTKSGILIEKRCRRPKQAFLVDQRSYWWQIQSAIAMHLAHQTSIVEKGNP